MQSRQTGKTNSDKTESDPRAIDAIEYRGLIWLTRVSQVVLVVKNLSASAGDVRGVGLIPRLGRSLGGECGNPLQYSWTSLVAQLINNPLAMGETWV